MSDATSGRLRTGFVRPFKRADLEIYGINTFRPSYTIHVFLNDKNTRDLDRPEEREGYAGRFSVFGHPQCVGDDGHCHVPTTLRRFDGRPSHPLTPAFRDVKNIPHTAGKRFSHRGRLFLSLDLLL